MKSPQILNLSLALLVIFGSMASWAGEWDSLGSSEALLEKARAIDPENKVRVVQKRAVDRHLRFELAGHYGLVQGGDSYSRIKNGGGQVEFHLNPNWSLGYRFDQYMVNFTPEGQRLIDEGIAGKISGQNPPVPEISWPINSHLGTISWYPIYGKLNLFDSHIAQFDLYVLAGAGSIKLLSTESSTLFTAGGGVGLWLTQFVSTRFEARYQGYKDPVYSDSPQMNTMLLNVSLGILL